MQEILSAVDAELFGVWFLIGAAVRSYRIQFLIR